MIEQTIRRLRMLALFLVVAIALSMPGNAQAGKPEAKEYFKKALKENKNLVSKLRFNILTINLVARVMAKIGNFLGYSESCYIVSRKVSRI